MKWLHLQLLLLLGGVVLPVSGKLKDRVHFEIEFLDYLLSRPRLKSCPKTPTTTQCGTPCKIHLECPMDHLCCVAVCGKVCMKVEDMENENLG
uniref:protein WFDC10B-like n=1 Tax=Urocitellus parryii TaxID=9999 RepID=UPI000E55A36F|nr:protein WFDC10B-like [Urocitellus parryii]